MSKRPKIKIRLTPADKITETFGWGIIVATWSVVLMNYAQLPDIIPTHYNGAGVADGFGDKQSIFALPLLATVLFTGLGILNTFPHAFNYPIEITPENALRQYTVATRMIRWLKVVMALIFGAISYQTIQYAMGAGEGLGAWFLPLTIGLIVVPLIYFLIKSSQNAG